MKVNLTIKTIVCTLAFITLFIVAIFGLVGITDAFAGSAKTTKHLKVGGFTVTAPQEWQLLSGSEEEQLKSEIKQGIDRMMERYRNSTGREHGTFGIRDFKALRLPNNSGWCILHLIRLPAQTEYYSTIAGDSKQKLDWGLSQGIIERVIENGPVKIGEETVMKTIVRQKGGGRMITIIYWSPRAPSDVTQLMILENKGSTAVQKQVDNMLVSLKVGPTK